MDRDRRVDYRGDRHCGGQGGALAAVRSLTCGCDWYRGRNRGGSYLRLYGDCGCDGYRRGRNWRARCLPRHVDGGRDWYRKGRNRGARYLRRYRGLRPACQTIGATGAGDEVKIGALSSLHRHVDGCRSVGYRGDWYRRGRNWRARCLHRCVDCCRRVGYRGGWHRRGRNRRAGYLRRYGDRGRYRGLDRRASYLRVRGLRRECWVSGRLAQERSELARWLSASMRGPRPVQEQERPESACQLPAKVRGPRPLGIGATGAGDIGIGVARPVWAD